MQDNKPAAGGLIGATSPMCLVSLKEDALEVVTIDPIDLAAAQDLDGSPPDAGAA